MVCLRVTYRGLIFMQHLVIPTQCHTEDNGRHVLKAVDPFLPLRPLTSHIKQPMEHTPSITRAQKNQKQPLRGSHTVV